MKTHTLSTFLLATLLTVNTAWTATQNNEQVQDLVELLAADVTVRTTTDSETMSEKDMKEDMEKMEEMVESEMEDMKDMKEDMMDMIDKDKMDKDMMENMMDMKEKDMMENMMDMKEKDMKEKDMKEKDMKEKDMMDKDMMDKDMMDKDMMDKQMMDKDMMDKDMMDKDMMDKDMMDKDMMDMKEKDMMDKDMMDKDMMDKDMMDKHMMDKDTKENEMMDMMEETEDLKKEDKKIVEVDAPIGLIRGLKVEQDGEIQFHFLGIPYAEAPAGSLRFMPPQPLGGFGEEPFEAYEFGSSCPQMSPIRGNFFEEDCLFLNVFTPRIPARCGRTPPKSSLLPVMVWIHGGGFSFGSGNTIPRPLVKKGVVVVTINYRLGALGFFSLGSNHISGNMGLKDQLEALRWVQGNIIAFGGDPEKVTIFGESAGAMSVHLHQLSPLGKGLYRGAIAQSGVAISTYLAEPMKTASVIADSRRFTEDFNCSSDIIMSKIVRCLQSLDVETIVRASSGSLDYPLEDLSGNAYYTWLPVVDSFANEPFIPDHPLKLLRYGEQKDIPFVTGVIENEGTLTLLPCWNKLDKLTSNWTNFGPKTLFSVNPLDKTYMHELKANVSKQFYVGSGDFTKDKKQEIMDMFGDFFFVSPAVRTLQYQAQTMDKPVYMYRLMHKPSLSISNDMARFYNISADEEFGPGHGDDTFFLFDLPSVQGDTTAIRTEEDREVQDRMVTLWSNFAKYADPTPFREDNLVVWKPFTENEENYLNIAANKTENVAGEVMPTRMFFIERIFWEDIEEEVNEQPMSSYRPSSTPQQDPMTRRAMHKTKRPDVLPVFPFIGSLGTLFQPISLSGHQHHKHHLQQAQFN